MYKCVLYITMLPAVAFFFAPPVYGDDFFNDSLLRGKTRTLTTPPVPALPAPGERLETYNERRLSDDHTELSFPGLQPKKNYLEPPVSYSDSININTLRINKMREIMGLRREPYFVAPVDSYIERMLRDEFTKSWKGDKKRMGGWSEASKESQKGGITDLEFVIPGSKTLERFVGGETRINIDGREKITFSGRSEWTEGQIETSVSKNSSFPSLTMKQEPSFRINGDVGRIHVDIKQDPQTGRFSNLEENIKIKYQGEERDIIKFIEAGSTSLTLEGATFAGYRGSHKGLFGIRSEGQLGPLNFTTIASQEKSEANTKSFRGRAEESSTQIRDYQYKSGTYFFLDFLYRNRFANKRDSMDRIPYNPADSLVVIEVYEDDSNIGNNLVEGTFALRGTAYPMDMGERTVNRELAIEGYYHKLDPSKDYYVDRSLGFIRFNRRVSDESTIGVYLKTKDGREYGSLEYDTEDDRSRIELKLIKRKKQLPSHTHTWDLEWKNVYDLGQRQIEPEGLEIRIYKEATDGVSRDTQDGTPYIHILGLDKNDETGNPNPDNKVDFNRGYINFYQGELIFPLLEPFASNAPPAGVSVELAEQVPKIYNTQNMDEKIEASRYYIEVKTANRQSTISVGGGLFGIMEGTEEVILNGKKLARGKDYQIDYNFGKITLLNEEAMSPTADLVIRYEEPNAFQQMQKTLVGIQADYDLFSDSRIGMVTLFKNESTKDRRVKLGQEPSRMLLFDTDAQINLDSRFLTRAVDKLPFLETDEISTIKIESEFASSLPTLNTRGEVYIDDFEGSHNTPMSVVRSNWTFASPPDPSTTNGKALSLGRLQWYNPWNRIKSKDIWPNKETTAGENTVHVLTLAYGKPSGVPDDEAYAGVMNSFYGSGLDMSRSRFIEIWARGAKGELKFDIGSISEDFYPYNNPNGILDTEDKPIPGQGHGDGILTKEEDTGLDGIFDSQEKQYYTDLGDIERAGRSDPSGDNFYYKSGDKNNYSGINGTEGNSADGDRIGTPDSEDINRNGILDTLNSYYEYTISFEDPYHPYLVEDSIPEGDPYGWRLFRIPLWNNPRAVTGGIGAPDSTLIEFARMWITNTDSTLVQIASIEIVESTWLEQGVEGELEGIDTIRTTTVNTHENREYTPPPGVRAEIDPETKIRRKEQSIVLKVENLQPGNSAFIYRNFEKMNFTDYTSLKMFVHGPEELPTSTEGETDVELVLRFGGDKNNYYEYRTPVYKGWDTANFVNVDLMKVTSLKTLPEYETYNANPDSASAPADTVGTKIYTLFGQPSLDNIKIVSIGLHNQSTVRNLTCDVWVDELRMETLRDMTGTATRVNLNTNLAGFMSIAGRATKKSADFHDMNSKTGTGQDNTDWNTNLSMNLDRFTPKRWNLRLPVSGSISETSSLPRLKSGSDIVLTDAQKKGYETRSSDKKYRISFNKGQDQTLQKIKWTDLKSYASFTNIRGTFLHWTLEKLNTSYDWGERKSHSPFSGESLTETTNIKATYDVNPTKKTKKLLNWLPQLPFDRWEKLANLDFAITPSQLNYEYNYDQRSIYKTNIDAVSDTTINKNSIERLNIGFDPINNVKYTYKRQNSNDLILGQEVEYNEENRVAVNGPTILYITNNYNYTASYREKDNPRYSITSQLGSKSITLDRSFTANANFDWAKIMEDLSGRPKPPSQKFRRANSWNPFKRTKKPGEGEKEAEEGAEATTGDKAAATEKVKTPDEDGETPDKSEEAPGEKVKTPDEVKETPDKSGEAPGEKVKTPDEDGETTDKSEEAPTESEKTPKEDDDPPRGGADAPEEAEEAPEEAEEAPEGENNDAPDNQPKSDNPPQSQPPPPQEKKKGNQPPPAVKDDGKKKENESGGEEGEAEPEEGEKKKEGPGIRQTVLMAVSRTLTPITVDYSNTRGLNLSGIEDRPDFTTRFGRGSINEPDSMTVVSRQNSIARNTTLSASTKINLPLEIGISTTSRFDTQSQDSPSSNTQNESATPFDIKFNWSRIEDKVPYIKKYVTNVSLSSGYKMTNAKTYQNEQLRSIKRSLALSPLISINANIFKKIQVSFNLSQTTDLSNDYSGSTKSTSEATSTNTSTSLRYSISPSSGLPFLKKIKLNSNINLSLTFSTRGSESLRGVGDEKMAKISTNDSWSISPKIDYNFSSKFRGGMSMEVQNSVDMTRKVRKIREVSIWGELMF